jgi:MFS family permease
MNMSNISDSWQPRRRPGDLGYYLAGSLLANLGVQVLGVAVGWEVYARSHRALDLGYVGLAQFVPAIALTLPAGDAVDRLDRGRVLVACYAVLAACGVALAVLTAVGGQGASVAPIYAVLVVTGAARAFEGPASQAIVPGLVPPPQLTRAMTASSTAWQVATIAGPALGGALYGLAGGAALAYAACAAMLGLAALCALAIRPQPPAAAADDRAPAWRRALAGLGFVRRQPEILQAISLDLCAVLLGGATALLPIYARDILRVGPWGLGLLRGAPAAGAAAIALILAVRPLAGRIGRVLLGCVALFGAATVVFGMSRSLPLSLAALAVLGAADMVSVVVRSTVVQLHTPPAMRGRVSAVHMLFVAGSSSLGELESGATAAWLGAVPAVVLGGLGTIAVVVIFAIAPTSSTSRSACSDRRACA